ncbi:hypothetical protein [Gordonia defluvii]|uniref:hypothetical protein n=1 Tax=Gordonia defluvii TaxID=283718 RepID=UPI0031DBF6ED
MDERTFGRAARECGLDQRQSLVERVCDRLGDDIVGERLLGRLLGAMDLEDEVVIVDGFWDVDRIPQQHR